MKDLVKRIWPVLAALMLCLPLFSGVSSGHVQAANKATAPDTQNIILHKLLFKESEVPVIDNTGHELTDYQTTQTLDGVEFTVYDATKKYLEVRKDNPKMTHGEALKALEDTKESDYTNGEVLALTQNGVTSKTLKTTSGNQKNAVYIFFETKTPEGASSMKKPLVVGLPFKARDTGEYLKDVHLYPKNSFNTTDLQFTKLGQKLNSTTVDPLGGAKFKLYRFNSSNEKEYYVDNSAAGLPQFATTGGHEFTSDATTGLVKTDNLALPQGTYYFEETEAPTNFHKEFNENYAQIVQAVVAADGSVAYTYYNADGSEATGTSGIKAYNYPDTEIKKEVSKDDLSYDEVHKYTVTLPIPNRFKHYEYFNIKDTPDPKLDLVTALDEIKLEIVDGNRVIYTFEHLPAEAVGTNGFEFNLIVDNGGLTDAEKQIVENNRGKQFRIQFDMKLQDGAELEKDLVNTVVMDNNLSQKDSETKVQTYGHNFIKVDGHDNDNTLKGAEFKLYRKNNQDTEYRTYDEATKTWGWSTNEADPKVKVYVSGDGGLFSVAGLETGDYYLKETKAPTGYPTPTGDDAITEFAVSKTSHSTTATKPTKIANTVETELPITGGMGIIGLIVASMLIITSAVVYFKKRHKTA